MKKWIFSAVLLATMGASATAQTTTLTLTPDRPLSSGELFQGMSKAIPNGRIVLPYGLEVTFEKTVHLIFPAPVRYVDLGSQNIIAGKAEDAENVLRVKAAVKDFETETNMSVICEDGSFYAFNVKYADEPEKLNVEMKDFLSPVEGRLPSNRADIYFKELGNESPILVKLMMKTIYQNDKRVFKHIGTQMFGMKFLLRGLYAHNGLLYFHTRIDNMTNMPYSVDFVTFKVVDKKVAKRTAIQEQVLQPLRAYHQVNYIKGRHTESSVFALEQFSLSEDKQLEVTLYEHNGGRTLTFYVEPQDLLLAQKIDNLKLKW
ncbi:conjugal transfer protein [Prevotella sp. S7-1-8]|uniref:Conjugative transposon TraN protein n=3 Tax=Prevotellaceae TaxID=171552 RepID=D1W0D0_9BACT|nr:MULTISPECIES: conjugative transposon protein TraN [Prevotellaceae]EFA97166.1 conjugative transposon TraN protein [Hoylesella timonensis CRIS 5C-B1]KGF13774.1 conjugal transfer protein [Prevotella sp. S7-1-8]